MTRALVIFTVLFAVGCWHSNPEPTAATSRPTVGSLITVRGVAENWKVGAFLAGPNIWVDLPDRHWPSDVRGKSVEVTGTVVERHDLPVFVNDPEKPPISGIPVPPGTDLHAASRRLILENAEWKSIGDGR